MLVVHLLFAVSLITSPSDTVVRRSIEREVSDLVRIDTFPGPDGRPARVVGFAVDQPRTASLLAPFLRAHGRLVWYLAVHTPGTEARLVRDGDDPTAVRDSIVRTLHTSAAFNDRLLRMLAAYWRPSGRRIAGYASAPAYTPVPLANLSRIGARFFYPDRVSATGDTLSTHICAGINGISDLPEAVDPLVEAFVFVAVNTAINGKAPRPLRQAFETAGARAKMTSVSKEPATRILRAQGALWAQLEQSPAMVAAMRSAYATHRAVLPFRLASAAP